MEDLKKEDEQFYFDINEKITDHTWVDEPLKEALKISLIMLFFEKYNIRPPSYFGCNWCWDKLSDHEKCNSLRN